MSGSVNRVLLIGNLCADPEVRTFQNGGKVCNLRLATSQKWSDKQSGERREKTEWHSVAVFQEGAVKFAEQYLHKGSKVYIEGKLETRKWQDQSGQDRYSTEIVVRPYAGELTSLDKAEGGGNKSGGSSYESSYDQSPAADSYGTGGVVEDEIPFAPEWRI